MRSLGEFLELYAKKSTKDVYRAGIFEFLDFIYGRQRKGKRVTKEEKEKYEELSKQYFNEERDSLDDVTRFAASLYEKPPWTAKGYLNATKEFLAENGIEFSQRELKRIRNKLPKGNARTVDKDMDHTVLKSVLQHLDVKGRALILVLVSSGMRIGEALSIEMDDIILESEPAEIKIRGEYTRTGNQRSTFISREAKEALDEWFKIRDKWLNSARNKNKGLIGTEMSKQKETVDNRVFPFSEHIANQILSSAVKKAGLNSKDKTTNRSQIHLHSTRKFFRSQLALNCPVDIVEALMGHEGYLTDAYRRYTKKQMAEYYQKAEHLVTISMPKEIQEMESEFRGELDKNRKLVEDLVLENKDLKKQNEEMKKRQDRIERILVEFGKTIRNDQADLSSFQELIKEIEGS